MKKRRQFIKLILHFFSVLAVIFSPIGSGLRLVWASAKKVILPKGTLVDKLRYRNPADLDTRNLDLTPVEEFDTMGLDDLQVDLKEWRLEIRGNIQRHIKLTYSQVIELPSVKRDVLLICEGFFAFHAHWEGVSVTDILEKAKAGPGTTHVTFSGPAENYEKSETFPIQDIINGKVFLAHHVNNEVLPVRYGFPLRVVAEDYYGKKWVKYVDRITVEKL